VDQVEHAIAGPPEPLPAELLIAPLAEAEAIPIAEALPAEPEPPLVEPADDLQILVTPTASRRLVESLVIFISAILFLRAMAVEPFGVPTGSMAPTLTGNHKFLACPRCSFPIRVGESDKLHGTYPKVACPNCGKPEVDMNEGVELAGDRLLVDKNLYSVRSPRRWEIAVFRCPSDMTKPYVKRVIGLPGERIQIKEGDILVNEQLARKTLSQCRETRVTVFDMNYPPKVDGWLRRWMVENKLPADPAEPKSESGLTLADRELRLDTLWAPRVPVWIMYKHQRFDEPAGIEREEILRDIFVYNGAAADDHAWPVYDFSLEFELEVLEGSGSISCRMTDGQDVFIASHPIGNSAEESQLRQEGFGIVRSTQRRPLLVKKKHFVEMAFVDRRVSFAIDGKEVLLAYDLEPATKRVELTSPFALGLQGVNVVIRDLKLYRDIYYRSSGENAIRVPLLLGSDEYFMLGDNSANSNDSRSWPIPGVPERNFLGKPFLLHQPSRLTHVSFGGRERVFQSIDWSRIRFLR